MAAKPFSKCETSIYIWFLQVLIILGLASLAVWASLRPKTPVFTISNMDFNPYHNHTALATTSSSLAFNVTISNPNKMAGIFFDELNVTLRCKNDSVGSRSISGFYLGQKISMDLEEVDLAVNGSEIGLCGKVDFRIGLETGVRYKIVWFKTKHRGLAFEDYVESGPDGRMLGTREMKLT